MTARLAVAFLLAGPTARTYSGEPVHLGEWETAPMGVILRAFAAVPGERYRLEARWPKGDGPLSMTLSAGKLPAVDHDLDDAQDVHDVQAGPAEGTLRKELRIPKGANAVWFRIIPTGKAYAVPLEFRITKL